MWACRFLKTNSASSIRSSSSSTSPTLSSPRSVSQTTIYRHAFRNIKWGVLLFLGGVVMLLFTLSVHFLLAFVGVLIMLVALMFIERNARKLGRAGMEQMTKSMRARGVRDAFGNAGQRMRDRFKRDE